MTRTLSVIAVILSAAALIVAIWTASRANALAEAALKKRELATVERLKPRIMKIYDDFDTDVTIARNATTLDDLFEPMFKLLQSVSGE